MKVRAVASACHIRKADHVTFLDPEASLHARRRMAIRRYCTIFVTDNDLVHRSHLVGAQHYAGVRRNDRTPYRIPDVDAVMEALWFPPPAKTR